VAVALIVATASAIAPARADEESDKQEATERVKEGVALQKQGKLDDARRKYLQALAVYRGANTLLNLAVLEDEAGHALDALRYVREYLAHPKAKPDMVAKVRGDLFAELMSKTGHVQVDAPAGTAVQLDGKNVGVAPVGNVDVMPGKHTLATPAITLDVNVNAGETKIVVLEPKKDPPPPVASSSVPPSPTTTTNSLPPHSDPTPPSSSTRWIVGGAIAGVGVVGVAVGAGFAASTSSAKNDVDTQRAALGPGACANPSAPQCAPLQDRINDLSTKNTVAYVGYIGGLSLVAVGAATILLWPTEKKREAWLSPIIDRATAGAALTGTF
jgi:hypothetical protein